MKIELSDYFKDKFRSAYLFENNKRRRVVELVPINKTTDKKRFISYAKYLWISEHSQEVPEGYEVDHVDNNPRNDVIENLQLLLKKENSQKYHQFKPGHPSIELICPICGRTFYREYRQRYRIKEGRTTCSRKCSLQITGIHLQGQNEKKAVIGTNILTGEERWYESTLNTTKDGFCQQHVSKCCNGKQISHKGYTWRFA